MKKTLGIIGGMGPLATVNLFERIVLLTEASIDQEHINILIDNNVSIPDRSKYILKNGEDPRSELIKSAKRLENMGSEFLIMPCNTAHYFYDDIKKEVNIPFLSMIDETLEYISVKYPNHKNIGLLATEGTYKANVYDNKANKYDINIIRPSEENQEYIMELIYNIKKGINDIDLTGFNKALKEIHDNGVDIFIVGCTELSVALKLYNMEGNFVDPIDIIARKAIEFAGGEVLK